MRTLGIASYLIRRQMDGYRFDLERREGEVKAMIIRSEGLLRVAEEVYFARRSDSARECERQVIRRDACGFENTNEDCATRSGLDGEDNRGVAGKGKQAPFRRKYALMRAGLAGDEWVGEFRGAVPDSGGPPVT